MHGAAAALAGCGAALLAYGLFSSQVRDRRDLDDTMRADRRYHRELAPYIIGVGLALLTSTAVLLVVSR